MATDDDLEARVTALEQAASYPAYTPLSGLQIDAAGAATYDFDGHVHARGLDLAAGETASPLGDREIRWLRDSDGAVVAEISTFTGGFPAGEIDIRANRYVGAVRHSSGINITADTAGSVEAYADDGLPITIIDAHGGSSFLRASNSRGASGQISGGGPNLWSGVVVAITAPAARLLIRASSTGYVTAGPSNPTWQMLWDGVAVASQGMFFNVANQHLQLPECVGVVTNVAGGSHTLQLQVLSGLSVNTDDACSWSVTG